ncbi:glycosyltransferase [Ectothiorhodospira lacustris]|uniref:glycosyltransferase n=1 Tax=Ectothiorhodospira lacustris TaxID=2899127 RepID=UPI001EE8C191|nr:glycosyltransferase [Ectothiorhodospira lacustris]MCG5510352.1 glycosyltransferase [Ectothiorhodospira lacustris]MCG5522098.1 glycosyltransferase [Ectothiorhodospira lacustris]
MPSYNTGAYIQEAIESVLDQDYPNIELIIVDDGSTDETIDLLKSYGDRITLITQENQGAAAARNAGMAAAAGEYIAFLDSDDIWLPGKLSLQIQHLERHPNISMVYARWQVWKPDTEGRFPAALSYISTPTMGQPASIVPDRSGWLYNRLLFSSLLHTITVVFRRTLIDTIGLFDTTLKRGQDYDYWIRASRVTEIHQLDRILALYRVHGRGCIHKWPHENYERIVVEKALARWGLKGPNQEYTAPADIKKRLADISFDFGYHHYWAGDPQLALRSFAYSATRRPGRPATWRYLLLSAFKTVKHRHLSL